MRYLNLLFLFFACCANAQRIDIAHLRGDHYVFTTYKDYEGRPFPSNGLYVLSDKGVILLDTPWDPADCQPLLDTIEKRHGQKVVFCLATHFHDDRTAGLDYFKARGIATWSSAQTRQLCQQNDKPQAVHTFAKDTVFTIGNKTFRTFYPGKGHAPDNILVWFEDIKLLYGGCFVKSTENADLGNLSHADVKAWPESVRKALKAFPERNYVIPGHFGWEGDGLSHTLRLLEKKS